MARAPAAVQLLRVSVVDEPHGPARDPGELGSRERFEAGTLLGTEASPDELRSHPDVVPAQSEGLGELLARREHALGRHPDGELVAVPRGDGRVGLERRLQLGRGLDGELDRHLRSREGCLRIAAGVVRRVRGEALLVERVRRVDDVRQHLEVEVERGDPRPRGLQRVCRDDRDRLAGVAGLVGEQRAAGRQRELAVGADDGPDGRGSESGGEVERADAPVGGRRAKHRRVEHSGRPHVDREADASGCAGGAVLTRRRAADERELGPRRPGLDVVCLVDERPDVLVPPLHLLLRANEPGHDAPAARRIARSIFGYAPQRQRLPAIACADVLAASAAASARAAPSR